MFKHRLLMLILAASCAINALAQETSVTVATFGDLKNAINGDATTITLTASFEATENLTITRDGVTLDGGNFTITNTNATVGNGSPSPMNLLNVTGNNVTIKNITLTGAIGNGLCFVNATGGTVDNVTLTENDGGGLQVISSTVDATGLKTSLNTWYGVGVDLTSGVDKDPVPSFTFEDATCTFAEDIQISSTNRSYLPAILPTGWIALDPTESNPEYVFTNRTSVGVGSYEALVAAIANPAYLTITLTESFSAPANIIIKRDGVTLDGDGNTITNTNATVGNGSPSPMNLVNVTGNKVTIKNITLTGAIGNGLCFVNATEGIVDNVTLTNNAKGGLQVVSSIVEATGLKTSDNIWYGVGISVTAGVAIVENPHFTFDANSAFAEDIPMKTESLNYVTLPENWTSIALDDGSDEFILIKLLEGEGGKKVIEVNTPEALEQILNNGDLTNINEIVLGNQESPTTVNLTAPLALTSNLTITSTDPENPVTIIAPAGEPAFTVSDGATLTLENINISGELKDGAPLIQSTDGILHLTGVHFEILSSTPQPVVKSVMTRSIVTRAGEPSVVIDAGSSEAIIDRVTLSGSTTLDEYIFITGSSVTLTNSLFYNNGKMKLITIKGGVATLINNTFVTDQDVELITYKSGTATIYNNILFTGATEAIVSTGGILNMDYNALKTASPAENSIALASLNDIKFAGATDFRLRSDSPLVGKGDASKVKEGAMDVAGNARQTSGKVNIGAYQAVYTINTDPEEKPFDAAAVPQLVLGSINGQSVLINWPSIDEAYYFLANVYQVNQDGGKVLISSNQYNRKEILSAGMLAFQIGGIDLANSYLIEITALGIFENELVTRSLTIEATENTTANAGLSAQARVYAQANTLVIESETPARATVVNLVGQVVYSGTVQGSKQIPVADGIYIVRLSGKETTTHKIHVAQ